MTDDIIFYTAEAWADKNASDEFGRFTVSQEELLEAGPEGVGDYGNVAWTVRVADLHGPTERPVQDEDPANDGVKTFKTAEAVRKYMTGFDLVEA